MYVPRLLIRSTACPKEKLYPAATPNTATVALIFASMVIFSPPYRAYANASTNKDKAMIRIPARIKYFLPYVSTFLIVKQTVANLIYAMDGKQILSSFCLKSK